MNLHRQRLLVPLLLITATFLFTPHAFPNEAAEAAPVEPLVETGGAVWLAKLQYGGWVTVAQLLLSVVAGSCAISCILLNRRSSILPEGLASEAARLWAAGEWEKLEKIDETSNSTLARIVAFLAKHRTAPVAELNITAGDIASREIGQQTQRAYPIVVIATIEPLLGLLGTIFGMIEVFDVVAVAGELGDPSLMASGISKALVTTAVGLLLAIPMLAAFHYFKSRSKAHGTALSEVVTDLISAWFLLRPSDKSQS
jgi:biopolymer transport protein ExbB